MTYNIYSIKITKQKGNVIYNAVPTLLYSGFDTMEQIEYESNEINKQSKDCETLFVMAMDGDTPIKVSGIIFIDPDEKPFIDCAEHDFRVIASVAFGKDFI